MRIDPLTTAALVLALAMQATPSLAQEKSKTAGAAPARPASIQAKPATPVKLVDLNSAGKTELKRLPGIGNAEADKIIAARPFRTKAELVTRKLIPDDLYPRLRKLVVVRNPPMPKLKGTGK